MFGSIPPSVACVRKRFPDKDERDLIINLTQKCRDSAKLPDPVVIEGSTLDLRIALDSIACL